MSKKDVLIVFHVEKHVFMIIFHAKVKKYKFLTNSQKKNKSREYV